MSVRHCILGSQNLFETGVMNRAVLIPPLDVEGSDVLKSGLGLGLGLGLRLGLGLGIRLRDQASSATPTIAVLAFRSFRSSDL